VVTWNAVDVKLILVLILNHRRATVDQIVANVKYKCMANNGNRISPTSAAAAAAGAAAAATTTST